MSTMETVGFSVLLQAIVRFAALEICGFSV